MTDEEIFKCRNELVTIKIELDQEQRGNAYNQNLNLG